MMKAETVVWKKSVESVWIYIGNFLVKVGYFSQSLMGAPGAVDVETTHDMLYTILTNDTDNTSTCNPCIYISISDLCNISDLCKFSDSYEIRSKRIIKHRHEVLSTASHPIYQVVQDVSLNGFEQCSQF